MLDALWKEIERLSSYRRRKTNTPKYWSKTHTPSSNLVLLVELPSSQFRTVAVTRSLQTRNKSSCFQIQPARDRDLDEQERSQTDRDSQWVFLWLLGGSMTVEPLAVFPWILSFALTVHWLSTDQVSKHKSKQYVWKRRTGERDDPGDDPAVFFSFCLHCSDFDIVPEWEDKCLNCIQHRKPFDSTLGS